MQPNVGAARYLRGALKLGPIQKHRADSKDQAASREVLAGKGGLPHVTEKPHSWASSSQPGCRPRRCARSAMALRARAMSR
jgi:hypothetical protein